MTWLIWIGFFALIILLISLDLGVFHRHPHVISIPEALSWTLVWVLLSLAFNVFVYFLYEQNWLGWGADTVHISGAQAALEFFTGYLVEKSLSLDNIFVIAMVLAFFRVPLIHQHRILYWGVLGAIVLRGLMIGAGTVLIREFSWTTYLFGLLLIASAVKMLLVRHDSGKPDSNVFIRLVKKMFPVAEGHQGNAFFIRVNGKVAITPMMLALVLVESSDVMFAMDSIPAIFAVTQDPFLVFTSNIFAILGLRSLYFALAGLMDRFRYLKMSLVFLLAYIGVKMLLVHYHPIPNVISLAVMAGILAVGVLASLIGGRSDPAQLVSPLADDLEHLAIRSFAEARRVVILVVGSTLILVGLALLVLPGPGIPVILFGLVVLSVEFLWARRWLKQIRSTLGDLEGKFRTMARDLGNPKRPD